MSPPSASNDGRLEFATGCEFIDVRPSLEISNKAVSEAQSFSIGMEHETELQRNRVERREPLAGIAEVNHHCPARALYKHIAAVQVTVDAAHRRLHAPRLDGAQGADVELLSNYIGIIVLNHSRPNFPD